MNFSPSQFSIFILGGGGHARVLLDILTLAQPGWKVAILDHEPSLKGTRIMGAEVIGGDELLEPIAEIVPGARFTVGLGSAANCGPRKRLFDKAVSRGFSPETLVHPSAVISKFSEVGKGSQLLPSCVINAGAWIGRNVIVNSGAVVEHDCRVLDHAHIATGAVLAGGVEIGESTHIGAGAVIRQNIRIGDRALIGAGAVVIRDVPTETVVAGVPAHPLPSRKDYRIANTSKAD